MCHVATVMLPPQPRTVPTARIFLREQLDAWELADLLDDAQLVLSELVTNAIVHANGIEVGVTVACADAWLELAVTDASPSRPTLREPGTDLRSLASFEPGDHAGEDVLRAHVRDAGPLAAGRGMQLVAALAESWGISPQEGGKAVWARFPAPTDWQPATPCLCDGSVDRGGHEHPLPSGRRVVDLRSR